MKIILLIILVLSSCEEKHIIWDGKSIPMPEGYRKITGYDSIQLIYGGRGRYNESKKDFDVTWDSLYANFCYPNKWEFEKRKKKDTVYIYDTIYKNRTITTNIKESKGDIIIGGN